MNAYTEEERWRRVMPRLTAEALTAVRLRLKREGHYLTREGEAVMEDTARFFVACGAHVAVGSRMTWQPRDVERLYSCMLDNILYAD